MKFNGILKPKKILKWTQNQDQATKLIGPVKDIFIKFN